MPFAVCSLLLLLRLRSTIAGHDGLSSQEQAVDAILRDRLAEQLSHYEVLERTEIVGRSPELQRMKRSAAAATTAASQLDELESGIVQLKFSALGRPFHLYLTQDASIFGEGFEAVSVGTRGPARQISISARGFYSGHIAGDTSSRVQARWEGDALVARIQTEQDVFYVEPLSRVLHNNQLGDASLVYRKSDLKFHADNSRLKSEPSLSCGVGVIDVSSKRNVAARSQSHDRPKRFSPSERNTCSLLVIADYTYFRHIADLNENVATNQMIDMISRVDKIFRSTDFGDGFVNMGFSIKKVIVHTEPSSDKYHYNSENLTDSSDYLNILSNETAHQNSFYDYCLVHLFTARMGFNGVLGMAFISTEGYAGGICSSYRFPPLPDEQVNFTNCGFTTRFSRANKQLLDGQAEVVLAHELGHNWGSNHDKDIQGCGPDPIGGSYIMNEFAPAHIQANSKIFSECSKKEIRAALIRNAKECFQVAKDLLRGNYRVDTGEACDAGVLGDECCSRDDFQLLQGEGSCSDANSVCCKNCSASAALGVPCRHKSQFSCMEEAFCNGEDSTCPEFYKEAGSKCLPDDIGRCIPKQTDAAAEKLHCATICETIGLRGCLCRDVSNRCRVCCQRSGEPCAVLTPALYDSLAHPCANDTSRHCRKDGSLAFDAYKWEGDFITMKQDTPCSVGYCDSEGVCQKQTHDKLISFLTFLSNLTPSQAVQFMKDNVVGTIVTFSLILWLPLVMLTKRMDNRWERQQSAETLPYCSQLSPQSLYSRSPLVQQTCAWQFNAPRPSGGRPLMSPTAEQVYSSTEQLAETPLQPAGRMGASPCPPVEAEPTLSSRESQKGRTQQPRVTFAF